MKKNRIYNNIREGRKCKIEEKKIAIIDVYNIYGSYFRLLGYMAVIVFSYQAFCEHVYNDGILVDKHLLSPDYWLNKIDDHDTILMTADDIKAFNVNLMKYDDYVRDPLEFPEMVDGDTLTSILTSVSSKPNTPRFYANKKRLTDNDFQRYTDNMNLESIIDENPIQFGIIVYRVALRAFPTMDRVFKDDMDLDLDRFQESALFPGECVAVLMESKDKQWYFVRNYQLPGWIHKSGVALASKQDIESFYETDQFVVVTGDKVFTNYLPLTPHLSELQLDMGTRLPLFSDENGDDEDDDALKLSNYVVRFPVRNKNGYLNVTKVIMPKYKDLSVGYLPFTKANIIKQSFKFLGEQYGWGHDFNSRDCTGFIGEIHKTFGLLMPRNSKQQGIDTYGENYRFDNNSEKDDKIIMFERLEIGDLLYISGHVMMFIGNDNKKPYVIHDTKGAGYLTPDGHFQRQIFNRVVITPILPLYLSPNTTYLDKVYNIKRIRAIDTFF